MPNTAFVIYVHRIKNKETKEIDNNCEENFTNVIDVHVDGAVQVA